MRRAAPLLALALGGCAGIVGPQDDPFAVPRPFSGDTRNAATVAAVTASRPVALLEIAGLSSAEREALAARLAAGAEANDILFVPPGMPFWYALQGEAVFAPSGVGISWELSDPDGRLVMSFPASVPGANPGPLAPETVAALAEATLARLAQELTPEGGGATPVAEDARLKLTLLPISGAPGDGAEALRAAMGAILSRNPKLKLEERAGDATLMLGAEVRLSPLSGEPGRERIDIAWRLLAPDGRVLGTITQSNDILRGSLDGRWGATALDIANAAVGGLYQLMAQAVGG